MLRCLAVAEHIAATQPAIVMLQEAVPPILELLLAPQLLGNHYEIICPENPSMPYYCVFLLHKQRVQKLAAARTRHFASSRMGRHFLAVDVSVDTQTDASLTFVTTHLESMKTEKAERVKQFTEVLLAIGDAGLKGRTVVLAGDLNIRDDEVVAARQRAREKSPQIDNIVDVWTWCGSPKGQEFTWDTSENTNLGVLYKSRCRFDRCFFLSSGVTDGKGISRGKFAEGSLSNCKHVPHVAQWAATDFTLVGQSQVEGLGRFPSDH
jgi:endonuclease/exonuclease/phosphatase family metal-dependent hydrolase